MHHCVCLPRKLTWDKAVLGFSFRNSLFSVAQRTLSRGHGNKIPEKQDAGGAEAAAEAFRTRSRDIPQKQALWKPGAETFLKSDDVESRNGPVWRGQMIQK